MHRFLLSWRQSLASALSRPVHTSTPRYSRLLGSASTLPRAATGSVAAQESAPAHGSSSSSTSIGRNIQANVASVLPQQRAQHQAGLQPAMSAAALAFKGDIYDGIIVDAEQLPADASEFAANLQQSLQEWRTDARKGIWLKVPLPLAQLVPVATQQGFVFHHAERDYVMLTQWLPDSEDKLPTNASHQVGIGAFVFNRATQQVLMVQEKNGPLRGQNVWKMPTGLLMAREDIGVGAAREVLEETGVRARFQRLLAMRQAHIALWGKSDMFLVAALEPEPDSLDITIQEDELVAAEWQSLQQFADNPFSKTHPMLIRIVDRCLAYARGEYSGWTVDQIPNRRTGGEDFIFFGPNDGGASDLASGPFGNGTTSDSARGATGDGGPVSGL